MNTTLFKKEQLELVAMAASLEVEWVGEDHQHAQLPTRGWKDWDPFENNDDAFELATHMGFSIDVNKRLNRTIVSNGLCEYAVSHGRDGKNVEKASRHAITLLAALMGLDIQKVLQLHGDE